MSAKQPQQYRQHFNLSESAKQMLDELTARRYPGKQRRQSQLVEDLISEAFVKEQHGREDIVRGISEGQFMSEVLERDRGAKKREGIYLSTAQSLAVAEEKTGYAAPQTHLCPACGHEVHALWKHCAYCGIFLALTCHYCGTPRAQGEDIHFCFECGRSLSGTKEA